MLGWEILISKKVQGSDKDLLIASWVTSTGGTSWIAALNLKGKRLLRISQEECDALMEAVFKEEGAYPDS